MSFVLVSPLLLPFLILKLTGTSGLSTAESVTTPEVLCLSLDLEKEEEIKRAVISHRVEIWRPGAVRESELEDKTPPKDGKPY